MFEALEAVRGDSLLALIGAYRADPRPDKIDVGVGVYKDEMGDTPILAAVKEAERHLLETQDSKSYLGIVGDAQFNAAMVEQVLGEDAAGLRDRVKAVQTAGGCGALRLLGDLVSLARPQARVWVSSPTWLNHVPLLRAARLDVREYPYYDPKDRRLLFDQMMTTLGQTGPDDVVLLHGCCHNPTGADLSPEQWNAIAGLAARRGFLPFVDLAYQGFGRGLDADAIGVRRLAASVGEMMVALSCSKNFALYRDRTGCALLISDQPKSLGNAFDSLLGIQRGSYSMPPDHGAAVVSTILGDSTRAAAWRQELDGMRNRLNDLRRRLAARFRERLGSATFDHIGEQQGMFSLLGIDRAGVDRLREEFAIYMPGDSRTNVAGLRLDQIDRFVDAVLVVRGGTRGSH